MIRQRLTRPPADYQVNRDNDRWPEHALRTFVTAGFVTWLQPQNLIDPACGDGSIALMAHRMREIPSAYLCDISGPAIRRLSSLPFGWTAEQRQIEDVGDDTSYDVVVLTEVLEHLPDPVATLSWARRIGKYLVASSPLMREGQIDSNPEHLWMFDHEGYLSMLHEAGWIPGSYTDLNFDSIYDFQIWACR